MISQKTISKPGQTIAETQHVATTWKTHSDENSKDGLTGSAWGDWANYTASPLRAFENELGAQAPLGFWDPLGLSSDGNLYSFKRRRSALNKCRMFVFAAPEATMGYITPEVAGKFPGYLSPSNKLLFSDIPNGLAAISKVPLAGWIQILGYCAYCEISAGYDADITKRTPGDMGWNPPIFSGNDPETKTRRLNAELANGRLAMMAIIGMFFQAWWLNSASQVSIEGLRSMNCFCPRIA
eukprot:s395_g44.t1